MKKQSKEKMVKVMIYISRKDHLIFKSKLALLGKSVSEWVRERIKIFLNSA